MKRRRSADPYRDTDVIDARAPRFNQAVIGSLALVSFLTGWWPLLAILAAQFAIGLRFGRRYCLPCLAYFELVQPVFGEGPTEDSRPPRFANLVGMVVLGAASVLLAAGLETVGWALGLLVAGLALFSAVTGICAGCEMYKLGAHVRGVRAHTLDRVDLGELGASPNGEVVVQFTHPLCGDCRSLERRLRGEGRHVLTVDVSTRPELARKYGIAVVPTAVAVRADGTVSVRLAG
jgi:thiol-disulfide isomerase/thioredoxin